MSICTNGGRPHPKNFPSSRVSSGRGSSGLPDDGSACGRRAAPWDVQPSAKSSASIAVNPAAKQTVPRLEWSPADISGISSSTTT